ASGGRHPWAEHAQRGVEAGPPVPAASAAGEATCHVARNDGLSAAHSHQLGAAFTNPRPTGRGAARATGEVTELASVALTGSRTRQAETDNDLLAMDLRNVAKNVMHSVVHITGDLVQPFAIILAC